MGDIIMSDVTFGVKVPEELKRDISKMMQDSGLTGKEFMQSLINVYQVEKTKENIPEVAQDLKELQGLTQRINDIYLSLGYRIENISKVNEKEMQEILSKKESIIGQLQDKIETLKDDKEKIENVHQEVVNERSELCQRVNELTDSNLNYKALIEEYKNKINALSGIVEEYKGFKGENEQLKLQVQELINKNNELGNNLSLSEKACEDLINSVGKLKDENDQLKQQIQEVSSQNNELEKNLSIKDRECSDLVKDMDRLKEENERNCVSIQNKAEFDKNKSLLDKDIQHQEEIKSLNDEINSLSKNYNDKVKELIKELEQAQKNNKTTITTKSKQEKEVK